VINLRPTIRSVRLSVDRTEENGLRDENGKGTMGSRSGWGCREGGLGV